MSDITGVESHDFLHGLEWSTGDAKFIDMATGQAYWQVTCFRGEQVIIARAESQSEAWQAACNQAEQLDEHGIT